MRLAVGRGDWYRNLYIVCWVVECIKALGGCWCVKVCLLVCEGVDRRWRTVSAWQWAAATLASRTMHMPGEAAGATPALSGLLPPRIKSAEKISGIRNSYIGEEHQDQKNKSSV